MAWMKHLKAAAWLLSFLFISSSFPILIQEVEVGVAPEIHVVQVQLNAMSLEEKVGQLFILDLFDGSGNAIHAGNEDLSKLIRTLQPGGFVFFQSNIVSIPQITSLISFLQFNSKRPLFIAVDQEGGPVDRLRAPDLHAARVPSGQIVGTTANLELAYKVGKIIGRELRALGFNMNLAPVADIAFNTKSTMVSRSYGSDPSIVAAMSSAVAEGMQSENISAVLKHFPGHGDTSADTHSRLITLDKTLEQLRAEEFVPFRRGISVGVDGIMSAHIIVPQVSGNGVPSTLSSFLLNDILRLELGHKKLIITDALSMGAIKKNWNPGEAAAASFEAGADILLRPSNPAEAYSAIIDAVGSGRISMQRLDDTVERILRIKIARSSDNPEYEPEDPEKILGNAEHQAVINEVLRLAEEANL